LDYNATTPVAPRVLEKMLPFFTQHYGNPSSDGHPYGWSASAAVGHARKQVAAALGAQRPADIVFTSGASESINTVIKGIARSRARQGRGHIITVQTEHKATLNSCKAMERFGVRVTYLLVDTNGLIDLDELVSALAEDTILVCVMWANNETGVLQPIQEISALVRERGILFMTDATQAVGKLPVTVKDVDVLACSAHKLYGPKGVGALYIRERIRLPALIDGGGQERNCRSGTLNVPGIVGLGEAIALACGVDQTKEAERLETLRDDFEQTLHDALPGIRFNGACVPRLPNTSNVTFPKPEGRELSGFMLSGLAISSGSACASGISGVSHVLHAMGVTPSEAKRTVRISLGHPTTAEEMRRATEIMIDAVRPLSLK